VPFFRPVAVTEGDLGRQAGNGSARKSPIFGRRGIVGTCEFSIALL
jgi:hypothetical protein